MKSKTGVLLGRLMRNIMRSPDTIITVAITPIMMMLLFVYVFGGAIQTGTENYVNYSSCSNSNESKSNHVNTSRRMVLIFLLT